MALILLLSVLSDCERFDVAVAERLVAARTVAELDRIKIGQSVPLRALYRSRRLTLNPSAAEERRFLRSLPKTRDELLCVYALTYPREVSETNEVSEAVYGMFRRAARIARKLGIGHDRVLQLALWTDGELAYSSWEAFDWLLEYDHELAVAALKRLPRAEQRRVCGDVPLERCRTGD